MGIPLFGVDISGLIKEHVGSGLLDATLIKYTPGTRTPGDLTGGTNPTPVSYSCKGMISKQAVRNQDGTLVQDGTKEILLIGDTIDNGNQAPALGDDIVIEGTTYQIPEDGAIDRDPAAATYTVTVRPK